MIGKWKIFALLFLLTTSLVGVFAWFDSSRNQHVALIQTGYWENVQVYLELQEGEKITPIEEYVKNGWFNQGLSFWNVSGPVVIIKDESLCCGEIDIIQLGGEAAGEELAVISQQIDMGGTPATLSFWYKLKTTETLPGLDSPALNVKANNQIIFSAHAAEATEQVGVYHESHWRFVEVSLPQDISSPFALEFLQGNTVDGWHSTTALVAGISTNALILQPESKLKLITRRDEDELFAKVFTGPDFSQKRDLNAVGELILMPDDFEGLTKIVYFAVSKYGASSARQAIFVRKDFEPPAKPVISGIIKGADHKKAVVFPVPADLGGGYTADYQVYYQKSGEVEAAQTNFYYSYPNLLGHPNDFFGIQQVPGSLEVIFIDDLDISSLAIRAVDQAGNISQFSDWLIHIEPND